MTDASTSGLAGVFPADAPGLPRGTGRIPVGQVQAAQRARILRAAITSFADLGYEASTVADIVTRARVSRAAFYRLFDTKQACLLAAIDAGRAAVLPRVVAAARTHASAGFDATVRATVGEYLRVCASEPEFTRVWALELPTAGPAGRQHRNDYLDTLASILRAAHTDHDPGTAALPETTYLALIGGCHELLYHHISDRHTSELADLEEPMVAFLLTGLRG